MKKYRYVYFDLDSTLWDYENNATKALSVLYEKYVLEKYFQVFAQFRMLFFKYNEILWEDYREGRLQKDLLRTRRFEMCFNEVGFEDPGLSEELNTEFLNISPRSEALMPGTLEILEYLREKKYRLFIITNGFTHIQKLKIKHTGLEGFFEKMFTSDNVGAHKPHRSMFDYCIKSVHAKKAESIMIGDDLKVDILGAKACGIDQVYYNPSKLIHSEVITYEIEHLLDLKKIL
ncbi:MAG TPA: YjjG family noncanonical pyrimidine nucleotidase [Bacteroidales bacterium]|nr:YjjG family noncanonical pyrimidine nucleotidase [Bacteroidales bacterium]